jgi:hypothetical protein
MKRSPKDLRLEEMLRSSKLVLGGFMGTDLRPPEEVIEEDLEVLHRLKRTPKHVAEKMRELRDLARPQLGNWVKAGERFEVRYEDYEGSQVCPWPHPGSYRKGITTARRTDNDRTLFWSDLTIHLIGEHGFFQGRGSDYRLEPEELVRFLFD